MSTLRDNINSLQSLLAQGLIDQNEFDQKANIYREEAFIEANRLASSIDKSSLQRAVGLFEDLGDYNNAANLAEATRHKLNELIANELKASKARKTKRVVAIIAVIVIVAIGAVVAKTFIDNAQAKSAYVGEWVLVSGSDESLSEENLSQMLLYGIRITITLNGDGTGSFAMPSGQTDTQQVELTWDVSGEGAFATINGVKAPMKLEGDKLVLTDNNGQSMTFAKSR